MDNKLVFDYKEPFNSPLIVRKITEKFSLPFNLYAFDVVVYFFALIFVWAILHFFIPFFTQWGLILYVGFPVIVVKVFSSLEPDGKKVHIYLIDYAKFLFQYQLTKKSIYQGEKISFDEQVIEYI